MQSESSHIVIVISSGTHLSLKGLLRYLEGLELAEYLSENGVGDGLLGRRHGRGEEVAGCEERLYIRKRPTPERRGSACSSNRSLFRVTHDTATAVCNEQLITAGARLSPLDRAVKQSNHLRLPDSSPSTSGGDMQQTLIEDWERTSKQ